MLLSGAPQMGLTQSCLPDGVIFSTQGQIDAFPSMYPGCEEIIGSVLIEEASGEVIQNLEALSQVIRIGQFLEIRNNDQLDQIKGLENLREIGGRLTISSNKSLNNLNALKQLNYVGESFRVSANASLEGIATLDQLKVIRGDLSISDNLNLIDFSGLQNLIEIDGSLLISGNAVLNSLNQFNSLRRISGNLLIRDNPFLKDLSGLPMLSQVFGDFIVDHNESLVSLSGLHNLSFLGGYLQIVNNTSLQTLRGLDAVKKIRGLLQIYNNPLLESLNGLDSIDGNSIQNLAIIACPQLKECGVKSICDFLAIDQSNYSILRNKDGCNHRDEILGTCRREGVNVSFGPNNLLLFPNPTSGFLKIKGHFGNAMLTITDLAGNRLIDKKQEGETIDIKDLPTGAYLIRLLSPSTSFKGIIIKV